MFCMCVYMHSHFVENHSIRILKDGPLISEVVLSHQLHFIAIFPFWCLDDKGGEECYLY
jgi:hypothetical protein